MHKAAAARLRHVALDRLLLRGFVLLVAVAASAFVGSASAQRSSEFDGVTVAQPPVVPAQFNGDLSQLPLAPASGGMPALIRPRLPGPASTKFQTTPPAPPVAVPTTGPLAPMPSPLQNFAGMSFNDACTGGQCGTGWPPDPNGDVGPNHYIEVVNGSVAIYSKTGTRLAAFTENQLWSGAASPPCTGSSQGDPVALYDWLADRFVITWFAFASGSGPFYQCIAASKTSDPVTGGWWLYAVRMDPGTAGTPAVGYLNDYGKFGLWHDCLYMGANEFLGFGAYKGVAFASFSRADMYSGAPLTYAIGFLPYPANNIFSMFPSNNNGKGANAVQPGTPNYFVAESQTAFAFEVRKFTAGPNCGGGGTLGAAINVSQTSYTFQQGNIVPQPNTTNKLDMIDDRIMQKVQYRKIGGVESLWVTHPVKNPAGGNTAMQWAQINVTGGAVVTTPVQQQIHSPDTSLFRFMGSLAVDSKGNMALGYTTSNGTAPNFPSIAYSGRLATDPLNTLPQTEVVLIPGAGSQTNNCGGAACDRWGDYSSMSVDPADDCTFWYTNEYYDTQANGTAGNWHTRIGSFKFPSCTSSGPTPTTTTLVSSQNPANAGVSVTFTATVTGNAPTGTVNFEDGASSIPSCSAQAVSGAGNSRTATCATNSLAVGTHSVTASYSGDVANAGSSSAPLSQVINSPTGSTVWVEDAVPAGATLAANGGDTWKWISSNPPPYSGSLAHQSALASGIHQHYFVNATATLTVGVGDKLFAYIYLDPANPPSEVMLQWNDGSWEHRAYWGANLIGWGTDGSVSRRNMGALPATGQWVRLEVPAAQVGLEGRTLTGMAYTLFGGRATWDYAGKVIAPTAWVDDAVPAGATLAANGGDTWKWISSNPPPYSGSLAHQSALASGIHQHYFVNATATLAVGVGDKLFAYIYLDPANPPSEVMLQWNDGSWEHRAYWGANLIGWGTDGSVSRRNMGALPATGQWVRLEVPAAQVGLEGRTLTGMAYTLFGGRATWDYAGK